MGQARLRGTYEQRVQQAQVRRQAEADAHAEQRRITAALQEQRRKELIEKEREMREEAESVAQVGSTQPRRGAARLLNGNQLLALAAIAAMPLAQARVVQPAPDLSTPRK